MVLLGGYEVGTLTLLLGPILNQGVAEIERWANKRLQGSGTDEVALMPPQLLTGV